MKRKIVISLLLFLGFTSVWGNNIRITGKPRVVNIVGDTAIVELNLSWENSWRDDFNWDAAWIFLKYKKQGVSEPWHHGYLSREGHEATPQNGDEGGEYAFMFGQTGTKVTGVFLMRDTISDGNVNVLLQLKWLFKTNTKKTLSTADFGDKLDKIYVAVHAIEMVYIPYGSYYLGDDQSSYSFAKSGESPCLIDSEAAVTLTTVNPSSTSVTLPVTFPKGYTGFYIMKYETSQEQYMEFLNSLTLTQQKAHVYNNTFSTMKRGDYVFGDLEVPNRRNGIVFIEQKGEGGPAVFGNNLNPANDLFSPDDGQTVACNFLSPYDLLAYCDWSGLRPMSELEYEKACRRPYPQIPEKGEYAWNSNSGVNPLTDESDLLYPGDEREQSVNKNHNVNSDYSLNGPVRCGLFATSSTNQTQSGATYWGVMEMSGNLEEMCYITTSSGAGFIATNFTYSHGDGELNADGSTDISTGYWPNAAAAFGTRGGCYRDRDSLLQTSSRTRALGTAFSSTNIRYAFTGFRGVRTLLNTTGFDGGAILCPNGLSSDTICAEQVVTLKGVQPNNSVGKLSYTWYYSTDNGTSWTPFSGYTRADLGGYYYPNSTTTYILFKIKRKVTCAVGEAEAVANLYIAPKPWTVNLDTYTNAYPSFTVTSTWSNVPQTHWTLETPPAGISISEKGLVTGLTDNSVFWTNVTVSSDKCPEKEYTKKIIVQREFKSVGSSSITLAPGEYVMECYGAEGGRGRRNNNLNSSTGKGGYSKGKLVLISTTTFYTYVGGKGGDASSKKTGGTYGWNGGGSGGGDEGDDAGGGGGGATDVRMGGQALSNRIMVAGGGGGSSGNYGGSGGGTSGGYGYSASAIPGTQSSGYALGSGGNGEYGGTNYCGGGGGGGGYYGGKGGPRGKGTNASGGGGGSGYVNTGIFTNSSMSNGTNYGNGLVRISPAIP